jgi:hypothetical protein
MDVVAQEAGEPDLVAIVVAVGHLAHAARVGLVLGRLQVPRAELRDARVEVVDEDGDHAAAGAAGILLDVHRPPVAQRPDHLCRVREERRLAEQPLVPGTRRAEVADAEPGEQLEDHGHTAVSGAGAPRPGRARRVTSAIPGTVRFPAMEDERLASASRRPAFVTPMKAVLTADRPAGPQWVFERKLDGIRCLAVKDGAGTRLYSRNELGLNDRYGPLAAALDADPADDFVVDGEAVAFVGGRDRFGGGEGGELFYYVFDVLFAGGRDVRGLSLEQRRAVLEGVLRWRDPLRMTEQMTGDGAALLARACDDGWEGLIAKRLGTPYVSTRSRDWLKLKCTRARSS